MLIHIVCNYNFTFYTEFTIIISKFTNKHYHYYLQNYIKIITNTTFYKCNFEIVYKSSLQFII